MNYLHNFKLHGTDNTIIEYIAVNISESFETSPDMMWNLSCYMCIVNIEFR